MEPFLWAQRHLWKNIMQFKSVVRGVGIGAMLAVCAGLPGRAWADQTTVTTAPAAAVSAVAQSVQNGGLTFAGDCASTQSPQDLGKICFKFVGMQAGVYAFETGRTFSEFDQWVFVAQSGAIWEVVATVPLSNSIADNSVPWPAAGSATPQPVGMLPQTGAT